MPRTVYLATDRLPIESVAVYDKDVQFINFYFMVG